MDATTEIITEDDILVESAKMESLGLDEAERRKALEMANASMRDALVKNGTIQSFVHDAIVQTLGKRDQPEDDGPHTDWTCPMCGNRDEFDIGAVVVTFYDVPANADGWDWCDCDCDGSDLAQGTDIQCDRCGYTAKEEEFLKDMKGVQR